MIELRERHAETVPSEFAEAIQIPLGTQNLRWIATNEELLEAATRRVIPPGQKLVSFLR